MHVALWVEKMEQLLRQACHRPTRFDFSEWKRQYDCIIEEGFKENPYQPPPRKRAPSFSPAKGRSVTRRCSLIMNCLQAAPVRGELKREVGEEVQFLF